MAKYIFILFLDLFEKKNERLCDFICLEEDRKNKVFVFLFANEKGYGLLFQ